MNDIESMQALLGVSMSKRVQLIGSSLDLIAFSDMLTLSQGPFSVAIPRVDALALAAALRADPPPSGETVRRVTVDGQACAVDASALRSVKTLMVGAFILALPRFAADEIAGLLELFASTGSGPEVGHA